MSASLQPLHTVGELLRLSTAYLAGKGNDMPRLDAEVLLAAALGLDRVGLYVGYERPLEPAEVDCYRAMIARRGRHEPVAYILGRKEFMSRSFQVTPAVLVPRPETEHLVEAVLDVLRALPKAAPAILDVGTGSGIIAVTLACELPQAQVVAVDVSPAALAVAAENAASHGVSERITCRVSDLLAGLPADLVFDCIVSNPPYILERELAGLPPEVRHEPRLALAAGPDGLAVIRQLLAAAPAWLAPGGLLALEIGAGQGDAIRAMAAPRYVSVQIQKDYAGLDRVALLYAAQVARPE